MTPKVYCIIVAAGTGSRFGSTMPKQFCDLKGRPVVMHTIDRLKQVLPGGSEIILVISRPMIELWEKLCEDHYFRSPAIAFGGETRWASVRNALSLLPNDAEGSIVMVHDAARPLVGKKVIDNLIEAINNGADGAVPAIAVTDSLRRINDGGNTEAVDRSGFRAIQTPQAFRLATLKKAYSLPYSPLMTDDASVVEAAGMTDIRLVEGNPRTLKITHPADMATVAYYLTEDGDTANI